MCGRSSTGDLNTCGNKEVLKMKKKFKCEVDCAACAVKLEDAIKKVEGVEDATVNFLMQKLTLVADEARFDAVLKDVIKAAKKVEPDTVITV